MKTIKPGWKTFSVAFYILITVSATHAQTPAQQRADELRLQLQEVQTKQFEMQQRLQLLDEQLKPENIEKSLAGVGSTRPEDLREHKRRQLEIEKTGIQKQLNLLAESKSRLETGLAQADAAAYHQSAKGVVVTGNEPAMSDATASAKINAQQQRPRRNNRSKVRPKRVRG